MRMRPATLLLGGIALAGLLTACGGAASSSHSSAVGAANAGAVAGGMMGSRTATSAATTADVSFAQLMIPHHQQAVQMADLAIANASSPEVQKLAKQIKAAQDPEISTMQSWLTGWGAGAQMQGMDPSAPTNGDMGGMDMGGMSGAGMMSQEDMGRLSTATGSDFDRMWLQMMIVHHQGAVTMAQQVLDATTNPDVQKLAQAVIDGQTAEIDTMQQLLAA